MSFSSSSMLIFLLALLPPQSIAQTYSGTFSGAFQVTVSENQGSAAVPAQCPSHAPVSCSSIGEPNWCCPSGNYCGMNQGTVGCCPEGQHCSYSGGGGGGGDSWQPTSTYVEPTSTYYPPATTAADSGGGGGGAGAFIFSGAGTVSQQEQQQTYQPEVQTQAQTQTQQAQGGQVGYCSTLIADGPGLPTERPGQCGTILVVQGGARRGYELGFPHDLFMVAVGGVSVAWFVGWALLLLH